jgi:4-hydroxy-tetrahydrodipicolinate reductase
MHRIVVVGAAGRMGRALTQGLNAQTDLSVFALVDVHDPGDVEGATHVAALDVLDPSRVDVVVDFSTPEAAVVSAKWCGQHGVDLVLGTTGLSADQRAEVESSVGENAVVMAANFSIGAVLSERFAAMAAPYFERVEIIELHHDKKVDAPSGTSLATAEAIRHSRANAGRVTAPEPTERLTVDGARGADGGDGIRIHSVRLPGLVAHQEVVMGGPGEGLTIRHDSFDRTSFVAGVALAIRAASSRTGFYFGIDDFVA